MVQEWGTEIGGNRRQRVTALQPGTCHIHRCLKSTGYGILICALIPLSPTVRSPAVGEGWGLPTPPDPSLSCKGTGSCLPCCLTTQPLLLCFMPGPVPLVSSTCKSQGGTTPQPHQGNRGRACCLLSYSSRAESRLLPLDQQANSLTIVERNPWPGATILTRLGQKGQAFPAWGPWGTNPGPRFKGPPSGPRMRER